MRGKHERRTVTRTRILRNAGIILNDRDLLLQCTLLDLTRSGARLSLASTYKVSENFDLTLDNGRTRRPCWVVWRSETKLGVSFDLPDRPPRSSSAIDGDRS